MHKTAPYGDDPKTRLKAASQGRAYRFLPADDQVRGVLLHGTRMVHEMRANHELGILETLLLGHGYLARVNIFSAALSADAIPCPRDAREG